MSFEEHRQINYIRRTILLTAVLGTTILATAYFHHRSDQEVKELRHLALPRIFQQYDLNRDGIMQKSELEKFTRDHQLRSKN